MEFTNPLPTDEDGGLLDMADLDFELQAPEDWSVEEDQSQFDARDGDDDANG
jgi:hypothetical protein